MSAESARRSPPSTALYATTVFIWGSTWFAIRLQLGVVDPVVSVVYRYALAAAILLGYCALSGRRLRFRPTDHLGLAALGANLFSVNYVVFYYATACLTSGLIALVFSTIVLMNMLNAALMFRHPLRTQVVIGAAIGLAGIALVFLPEIGGLDLSARTLRGLLLSIGATYLASLGNMASVWLQRRGLPVLETNAVGMAYGAVITLLIALALGARFRFDPAPGYVLSLAYLALFGSVVAFGCYLTLLGRIGPDRAAYATVLFPVVALAISTVFESYRWSLPAVAGVVLILAGNVLVLGGRRRA